MKPNPETEKLCKNCGQCCHEKLKINGKVFIFMNSPCPYLKYDEKGYYVDKGKYFCEKYEDRFVLPDVECLELNEAIKKEILPKECGYKEMFPTNYNPAKCVYKMSDINSNE